MAIKDAIATVLNRNAFYRDGYRLLLRISLIQSGIIILLIVSLVALALTLKPRMVYFATTSDGRIINIVPLNEPYRTDAEVNAWASATAQKVMRFGYHDYRDRLQESSASFTSAGWDSFNKAIKEANFLDAIQARKLVVNLDIDAAPEIQHKFVRDGVYTWIVRIPVTIKFDGDQPPTPINTSLIMQIVRVSTLQNPDGISIAQWVTINDNPSR